MLVAEPVRYVVCAVSFRPVVGRRYRRGRVREGGHENCRRDFHEGACNRLRSAFNMSEAAQRTVRDETLVARADAAEAPDDFLS